MINGKILKINCCVDNIKETQIIYINSEYDIIYGIVSLQFKNKRAAYLQKLYVNEDFRKLGIGTLLIKESCRIAKIGGSETIGLIVKEDNNIAQMLYEKIGFSFAYQYEDGDILMSMLL